jgi:uncharacterized protein YjbJ (UPF0337 family)
MDQDVLKGQWKQLQGNIKVWWGKLTDNDIDQIQGNRDKLIGMLQEKYGYTKEQANAEVDRRLETYRTVQ